MAAVAMAIQMDNERIENLERELADVRSLNEQYRSTNNSRSDTIDRLEKADQQDKARIEQLQGRLWGLLAVIHRDDGSYRADHGEEKAWQAAMQQVPVDRVNAAYYRQRIDQLKALLLESSDVIGKLADGPSHAPWGEMLDSIDAAIDQNAAPLVGQKARGSQHENFADRADAPGRAAPVSVYEAMARRLEQIAGIEDSHGESAFNVQLKREAARLLRELERSYRALTTKESPSSGAMPPPNAAPRVVTLCGGEVRGIGTSATRSPDGNSKGGERG